jgi:CspA family cold shock protein
MIGKVRKLKPVEGFGFIQGSDDVDRFFHKSEVIGGMFDQLQEGDQVAFEHEPGKNGKGPRAVGVYKSNGSGD